VPEPVRIVREPDLAPDRRHGHAVLAELTRPRPSRPAGSRSTWCRSSSPLLSPPTTTTAGRTESSSRPTDCLADLIASALYVEHHGGAGTWHLDCSACTAIVARARIAAQTRYQTVWSNSARTPK